MGVGGIDKAKKKDLTINTHVDDKDQPLESAVKGDRCTEPRERKSLWNCSIFVSIRLRRKFRFKVEGGEEPRIIEMVKFIEGMTLYRSGYCAQSG